MGLMWCIERLKSVERTLGDEGFKELKDQLNEVQNSVSLMEVRELEHLMTISAAHMAAVYLRQMQHSYPHHPMSGWSLQHQLEAVYSFLACEVYSPLSGVNVNFASDLEVKHVVAQFKEYPIANEN